MLVIFKVEHTFYFSWESTYQVDVWNFPYLLLYNLYVSNWKSSYDINDVMLFIF
jgi:hypothetical protein